MRTQHQHATPAQSGAAGSTKTTQKVVASGDKDHNARIAPNSGTSEVWMQMLEPEYREALQGCLEGRFTEELRDLYQMPSRQRVPWVLFPNWARPNDPVEGGHEGGSI